MKVAATSDLHGHLPTIPEADVLLICGDIGPATSSYHNDFEWASEWLMGPFSDWMKKQPVNHVVAIAGNHDFVLEHTGIAAHLEWNYLQDSGCTIDGVNFWGSPWSPQFFNWSFMDKDPQLERHWAKIPANTDVLLTHCPAFGVLDRNLVGKKAGSKTLRRWIPAKAYHFFGHIHEARGCRKRSYNVAYCSAAYRPNGIIAEVELELF